ncbi:MAG: tRNA uridine-5-carboxymethylaminomethyl(34) synthesis GTPase MnmE [Nitrospirae bacterium GWB2_47_37]|nr:MAG: tRNA uridine-5-carboxymethylaminomethyl(34) synthesis GTPase MnmE [Nitrospirae bacterium GWB2_47_37]HAK89806.1 tRNA uridine-5-carboxymethylaminomethyl(34) synthesis GTPase MnmE [Nitrospiraceae bacterium]
MNYLDDTIAAISTATGEGGIGIVRLSGKDAIAVADKVFSSPKTKRLKDAKSHTVVYGFIIDPSNNERIDEVLVTVMRAPKTYTKEDVVEINCHGGMLPLRKTLDMLLKAGARLAEPGEFTKRAFLNGRIDLSQAEAVIDVIRSKTEQAERLALQQLEGRLSGRIEGIKERIANICAHVEAYIDFPEEEIETPVKDAIIDSMQAVTEDLTALSKGYDEGKFFREGVSTAIVGKPNVGKSSLLNALLQKDRAIVTEMPGTTRDVIEDYLNINGLPLKIMDTAGIRETHDLAEMEGVKRSLRAIEGADIVIAVFDGSIPFDNADAEVIEKVKDKKTIFVFNKSDSLDERVIRENLSILRRSNIPTIKVSALTGDGIDTLKDAVYSLCISTGGAAGVEDVIITNIRHKQSIDNALKSIKEAAEALRGGQPLEVAALFLRESLDSLGEIVGIVTTEDILNRIFSEFCIGK